MTRRPYTEAEIREIVAEEVARYFDCLAAEAALAHIARRNRPLLPRLIAFARACLGSRKPGTAKKAAPAIRTPFHRSSIL